MSAKSIISLSAWWLLLTQVNHAQAMCADKLSAVKAVVVELSITPQGSTPLEKILVFDGYLQVAVLISLTEPSGALQDHPSTQVLDDKIEASSFRQGHAVHVRLNFLEGGGFYRIRPCFTKLNPGGNKFDAEEDYRLMAGFGRPVILKKDERSRNTDYFLVEAKVLDAI